MSEAAFAAPIDLPWSRDSSTFDPKVNNLEFLIYTGGNVLFGQQRCGHSVFVGVSSKIFSIIGADGCERGYVIGWPLTDDGGMRSDRLTGPAAGQSYADWARSFSGNFVCYLRGADGRSGAFYLDATGSLGLVYDPVRRTIASVPDLLAAGTETGAQSRGGDYHYGFGETSVPGIARLMPNFALDEADFKARRYWPVADGTETGDARRALTEQIFGLVRRNVGRVVDGGKAALHLTAGTDTRMVLAAAWERRRQIPFFTFATQRSLRSIDVEVTPLLARRFDLAHFMVVADTPCAAKQDETSRRTSYCVADGGLAVAPISSLVEGRWHFVGGIAGEVGRAYYWDRADLTRGKPTARELIARTRVVQGPGTHAAAEAWLATMPDLPAHAVWDLAYLEQRLGHWAGAMTYGFRGTRPTTSAFNSIDVVRGKLGLAPDYRLSGAYATDFIETGSKTLLRAPINRYIGMRRLLDAKTMLRSALSPGAIRGLKSASKALRRH